MSWDVLLAGDLDPAEFAPLEAFATISTTAAYGSRAALRADIDRFDAIVVRTFRLDESLLDRADACQVIAKRGVGLDSVDIGAATRNDIIVCNTPGANARAVAEHALALLLAVRRRLRHADQHVRSGRWDREWFAYRELGDVPLGLFGFGDTGHAMAELANGIGMSVLAYDPYVEELEVEFVNRVNSKAELFDAADVVSLHAPLTAETRGAVGTDELERLGPSGILINAARGGIVVEADLVAALDDGTIDGAGIDVFAEEPPEPDAALLGSERVVLTPHVAGNTVEANQQKTAGVIEHIRTVRAGEMPPTAVNAGEL